MLEFGFDNVSGQSNADTQPAHSQALWSEVQSLPKQNSGYDCLYPLEISDDVVDSSGGTAYEEERNQLTEFAAANMVPEEAEQFIADMNAFEQRAREAGMSEEEIRDTYAQIIRLFDDPQAQLPADEQVANEPLLMAWQRVDIAQQIMHQAAYPTSVDQGAHPTCTVASIEARMYTLDPSAAAQLVVDVALTGQYTFEVDGEMQTVQVDPTAHGESTDWSYTNGSRRSYASEIFETTALNVHYELTSRTGVESDYVYADDNSEADEFDRDSDGFVVETNRNGETTYRDFNGLPTVALVDIYNAISEEPDSDFVLSSGESEIDENDVPTGIAADTEEVMYVGSYAEFENLIATLAENGELPVIVRVWTNGPPFDFDVESGGTHVLNITGYIPGSPAMIEVDNQWGDNDDFLGTDALPLSEFYLAMLRPGSPEALSILEERVRVGRDSNEIDIASEMELLRQLKLSGISDEDFLVRLTDTMEIASELLNAEDFDSASYNQREMNMLRLNVGSLIDAIEDQAVQLQASYSAYELDLIQFDGYSGLESEMIAAADELIDYASASDDSDDEDDTDTELDQLQDAIRSYIKEPEVPDEGLEESLVLVYNSLSEEDQIAFLQRAYDRDLDLSYIPGIVAPEGWVPVERTETKDDEIDLGGINLGFVEGMRQERK